MHATSGTVNLRLSFRWRPVFRQDIAVNDVCVFLAARKLVHEDVGHVHGAPRAMACTRWDSLA